MVATALGAHRRWVRCRCRAPGRHALGPHTALVAARTQGATGCHALGPPHAGVPRTGCHTAGCARTGRRTPGSPRTGRHTRWVPRTGPFHAPWVPRHWVPRTGCRAHWVPHARVATTPGCAHAPGCRARLPHAPESAARTGVTPRTRGCARTGLPRTVSTGPAALSRHARGAARAGTPHWVPRTGCRALG
ncbi:Protein argonaute-1 [Histomonas meleagridis]|nr:Protein argonaute-1 [Histomonas meleagridis]